MLTIFFSSFQVAAPQSSPSDSTDSGVGETRRRTRKDKQTFLSRHSDIPNGDCVGGIDPFVLSDASQLPTTKVWGKRGQNRRRVVSDDEDLEVEEPSVVTLDSSEEDEEPIRYFEFSVQSFRLF